MRPLTKIPHPGELPKHEPASELVALGSATSHKDKEHPLLPAERKPAAGTPVPHCLSHTDKDKEHCSCQSVRDRLPAFEMPGAISHKRSRMKSNPSTIRLKTASAVREVPFVASHKRTRIRNNLLRDSLSNRLQRSRSATFHARTRTMNISPERPTPRCLPFIIPPTKGQDTLCRKPESLSRERFPSKARATSKKAASGEREAHFSRT